MEVAIKNTIDKKWVGARLIVGTVYGRFGYLQWAVGYSQTVHIGT